MDDYINLLDFSVNTAESGYTLSAWIYQISSMDYSWNLIIGDGAGFSIDTAHGTQIGAWGGGYQGSMISVDDLENNWHHIAGVYTKSSGFEPVKMYFDGEYVGNSVTDRSGPFSGNYGIGVSKTYVGYSTFFNGLIDEPMIFNKALTEEQVKALYELNLN